MDALGCGQLIGKVGFFCDADDLFNSCLSIFGNLFIWRMALQLVLNDFSCGICDTLRDALGNAPGESFGFDFFHDFTHRTHPVFVRLEEIGTIGQKLLRRFVELRCRIRCRQRLLQGYRIGRICYRDSELPVVNAFR